VPPEQILLRNDIRDWNKKTHKDTAFFLPLFQNKIFIKTLGRAKIFLLFLPIVPFERRRKNSGPRSS